MDLGLFELRASLLASLGLLAACGPTIEELTTSGESGNVSDSASASADGMTATGDDGPTDSGVEDTGVPPGVACEGATPIMQSNVEGSVPTGWELCANGVIHRTEVVACAVPEHPGAECTLPDQSCATDADCVQAPHGRCVQETDEFIGGEYCGCRYGCETDADCADDKVCACGGVQGDYPSVSRCVSATCDQDASCEEGFCALGSGDSGCGLSFSAACQTSDDLCVSDESCEGADCYPQAEGFWACEDFCCCGRPLMVEGRPITAALVRGEDWVGEGASSSRSVAMPTAIAQRIAEHWAEAGLMEHASVASFARFTLELLGQGAPPELLAEAQRAGLDEIDHARRCFALASAHAGAPVGPGALSMDGVEPATDFEAVMAAVIEAACVGETLAAVEARAALSHATCPVVRETLAVIAADEQRHAALGWKTLRWALGRSDASLRSRLLARLDQAIEHAMGARPVAMVDHDRRWLRAYGVLDPADRRQAHTSAVIEVLRPCRDALVGAPVRESDGAALAV